MVKGGAGIREGERLEDNIIDVHMCNCVYVYMLHHFCNSSKEQYANTSRF